MLRTLEYKKGFTDRGKSIVIVQLLHWIIYLSSIYIYISLYQSIYLLLYLDKDRLELDVEGGGGRVDTVGEVLISVRLQQNHSLTH